MALRSIPPRNANGTYTREQVMPAGASPIRHILATSNTQMGFAFFGSAEGTDALADGAVIWGHPQGGTLDIRADVGHLVINPLGGPIFVENRTLGYLSIHVE